MNPAKKPNLAQLGFGTKKGNGDPEWYAAQNHEAAQIGNNLTTIIFWKLNLSALFSQHRWLPLYAVWQRNRGKALPGAFC